MLNVMVTGGSRGLGLAIAAELARAGYCVIAIARKQSDELAEAIAEVEREKTGALSFLSADLGDIPAIAGLVAQVRKEFGPVYGLVNNAGLGTDGVLANMPVSKIEELVQLNTVSPIVLTKFVVRSMMAAGTGRIVNVSSIVSFTGYSGLSAYAATKASMIGFTKSLAREVGRLGITVNAVAPGFVETAMTRGMCKEDVNRVAQRSALRRLAEPRDVAEGVKFLLGESGRNITGTVLTIDAGGTA
jgi:3-oxoacyl-[acyl-carrier protein] reductase